MDPNQRDDQNNQGFIDRVNRYVSTGRRFRRRYGTGISLKQSAKRKVLKGGIIFLVSNPIGWFILLILLLLLLFVLVIVIFFATPEEVSAEPCDTGICYYKDGPAQVNPNEDICYQLTLIYDPNVALEPPTEFFDDYPEDQTDYVGATGFKAALSTEVTWDLTHPGNQNTSLTDPLEGCDTTIGDPILPQGEQVAYYFKLRLHPTITTGSITNTVGQRGGIPGAGGGGDGDRCTQGSTNDCGGYYNIAKNPDGLNFGDPSCEVAPGGNPNKTAIRDEILRQLRNYTDQNGVRTDKSRDYCHWTCIAAGESNFNPNSYNAQSRAWGMFQMNPRACAPESEPFLWTRTGNVEWRVQITRALALQYRFLEKNNDPWGYWGTARERLPNSCYYERTWSPGVTCKWQQ